MTEEAVRLLHSPFHAAVRTTVAVLSAFDPIWSLSVVSIVSGMVLAYLFGKVSPQHRITAVKRELWASLFEAVLYRHDLRILVGAQRSLLVSSLRYVLLTIPPLLILAAPSILLMVQCNLFFGSRGLKPGESALVSVHFSRDVPLDKLRLDPEGAVSVSPPVRVPAEGLISWRISAREGDAVPVLRLHGLAEPVASPVFLVSHIGPIASTVATHAPSSLLHPSGDLPQVVTDLISSIEITYPPRTFSLLGVQASWITVFLILSLASGFAAARVFGITF